MGGRQSKSVATTATTTNVPLKFQYSCDANVAKFINSNPKYFTELQLIIQGYAICENVTTENGVGKVYLHALKSSVTSTSKGECKKKLDEYFQKFMSLKQMVDSSLQFNSSILSLLHKSSLRCIALYTPYNNTVQITGVIADVTKLASKICEAKTPPSATATQSNTTHTNTSTMKPAKVNSSSSTPKTTDPLSNLNVSSSSNSTKLVSSSSLHPIRSNTTHTNTSTMKPAKVNSSSSTPKTTDPLSNLNVSSSSNSTKLVSSSSLHPIRSSTTYTNISTTKPAKVNSSSSTQKTTDPLSNLNVSSSSNATKLVSSSSLHPIRYLSTKFLFKCPAPDFSIARFVKYSHVHRRKLSEALSPEADAFVFQTKPYNKLEYRCRPQPETNLSKEEFIVICESKLTEFLENYSSTKQFFNHDHLMKVVAKAPEYFQQHPSEDSETVYVKWFLEDNKVLLCGIKEDVKEKENEIVDFLNTTVAKRTSCSQSNDPFNIDDDTCSIASAQSGSPIRGKMRTAKWKEKNSPKDFNKAAKEKNSPIHMLYTPKKAYRPALQAVVKDSNLYKELQTNCEGLCTITGDAFPLKVTSLNPKNFSSHSHFSKDAVKHIESFLDGVSKFVAVDETVGSFIAERKDKLLLSRLSESDNVLFEFKSEGIQILGMPGTVQKYTMIVEELLTVTTKKKTNNSELCRVLVDCGVIDEVNIVLLNKVEVTCSIDEGIMTLKGRTCYMDYAFEQLATKAELVEDVPTLTKGKLAILTQLLSNDRKPSIKSLINKKLKDSGIKAVLLVRFNKITLTAATKNILCDACEVMDDLFKSHSVDLPKSISENFVENDDWKKLITTLPQSEQVLFSVQHNKVEITGIDEEVTKQVSDLVAQYFKEAAETTRILRCTPLIRRYIVNNCAMNNPNIPESTRLQNTENGLRITGPTLHVERASKYLCALNWHKKNLTYSCPNLATHFTSDDWKGFVKLLESGLKCAVACDVGKGEQSKQEEMERSETFACAHGDVHFTGDHRKTANYGSISVSVCHGDITNDDSNIIINGATIDFDLSRGTVSPALLRKAGPKMQEECTSNPVMSSSVVRVTKGWNLLCDFVIHIVTPNDEDKLKARLKDALDFAEVLGKESVSLPTLGAGGIGLSCDAVAAAMSEAFEIFASENPRSVVKRIKVVVYDYSILDLYKDTIVNSKGIMSFGKKEAEAAKNKVKLSLVEDKVIILMVSVDTAFLSEANCKIKAHMEERIEKKILKDALISELDDHDCIDIYQAAVKHQVSITINTESSEITLKAFRKNVGKLYDVIRELLFELRESMTMSKIFHWKWASSSKQFTALPLRVGRDIERNYENTRNGTSHVNLYGTTLDLDFSAMTYTFNGVTGQLRRIDASAEKIPSDWSDMMGKSFLKVPMTSGSTEYERVTKLFDLSLPSYNRILYIERIQHPSLYKQYLIKKSDVERHMISKHPVERELFHGTSEDDADKICAEGFDRNFAGKNATLYGRGSYFAVNSKYSVNYATPGVSGTKYLFLARVLTGDFCHGHHDYKAPPQKVRSGDIVRLYDSVVDSETNPSIFVVFKDSSVYPYYLITFI